MNIRNLTHTLSCTVLAGFCIALVGCFAPKAPTRRTVAASGLSCEQANRLVYETVTGMSYIVTSLQVATPSQPGYITAKEGKRDGRVTITCDQQGGATVVAESTDLPVPSLIGPSEAPGEFPAMFNRAFDIIRNTQQVMAARGPQKGLTITMTRLNSFESKLELGADIPATGVLPVKVVINNNTAQTYGLEVSQIFLQSAGGGRVAPMISPPAGQGKALQGSLTLQPGQAVTGYLFYPAGQYTSASTTLTDKATDEREGFSIQF